MKEGSTALASTRNPSPALAVSPDPKKELRASPEQQMQGRESRQHGAAAANTVDGEDTGRFSYISKRQRAQREGKFQLLEEYTNAISRHTPSIQ